MFWVGKSLIQMKRAQEARNIFDEMAREFPESRLKPYAIREIEKLGEGDVPKVSEPVAGRTYEGEEGHMEALRRQEEGMAGKSAESAAPPARLTTYIVQVAGLDSEVKAFIDQYI